MDQELVSLLRSPDRDTAAKGAEMLASFLSRASFPSKSVQALREVIPAQQLQRILSALSQRLVQETGEVEVSSSLNALLLLLQSEEVRDAVLSVGDASLVELCRDLISGLSRAVRLPSTTVGMTAVAVFGSVCQSEKARQLLLQHSDTEPIFERIPQLLSDLPESSSIPLSVAYLTRYPSAQRRVLASGRCAKLLSGLNQLMLSSDFSVASDAACAVGNLAFNDEGRYQVLAYRELNDVVSGLTHILTAPEELAGNAAWAIGNLSRDEGWCGKMLEQAEWVEEVLQGLARLVQTSDAQTACDASCALAALVSSAKGTQILLAHGDWQVVLSSLLHHVQLQNKLVSSAAALALHHIRQPGSDGRERITHLELDLSDSARSKVATVMTNLDTSMAANAAIIMRGLPTASPVGLAPGAGGETGGTTGLQSVKVGQDMICVKALDGAVLRSLPIKLFTTETVVEDPRHAANRNAAGAVTAGRKVKEANSGGIGEAAKRITHEVGSQRQKKVGDVATASYTPNEAEGGEVNGAAGGEKETHDPAPSGLVVQPVQLESTTEVSLRVWWKPACPERTLSCRFVCDAGNGGHYRNVCTLSKEEAGEDGAFRCTISDLLPGREYRVLAIARTTFKPCHGALTMFDTKGVFRTAAAAPGAPEKPVLSSRTRTALKIRWVPPDVCGEDILSYEVRMCRARPEADGVFVDESEWETVYETSKSKDTSWKAQKLSPGQHYGFVVRASNMKGSGPFSPAAYYATAASVPAAPGKIWVVDEAGAVQGGKLVLAWETAASNGDPVSSYILEQDDSHGGAFTVIYNGPSTRFVAGGLMAGRSHKFRVKAANGEGAGQYSPVLEAAGGSAQPAACEAPQLVKAKTTALVIKWSEPDCRGSEIRAYRVLLAENGKAAAKQSQAAGSKDKYHKVWQGSERTCEVSGLQPGYRYSLKVMALNAVGEGEASPPVALETGADVPSQPQGLVVVSKGQTTCKLRWKPPATWNGSTLSGYRVEVEDCVAGTSRSINVAGLTCEYELQDLQPERAHTVQVRAVSKLGVGAPTEPLRLSPALSPPGPPGMPRLINAKATSLTIRWDPPVVGIVDGYRVEVQLDGGDGHGKFGSSEVYAFKTEEARAELSALRPVTSYRVRVAARNKSGLGDKGPVAFLRTEAALAPPTRLQTTVAEADGLVAVCSWERPEGHPPTAQFTYHMEVDDGGEGSADFEEVYVGPSTQYELPLRPGKCYKFRVRAVSSAGSSAWSVIKGFSRAVPAAAVPENVAAKLQEDGRTVLLTWSPPSGVTAVAYQVKVDLQEGKKRRDVEGLSCRRDDLAEGPHRFQVRAMANGKWSEWSREVHFVIPPSGNESAKPAVEASIESSHSLIPATLAEHEPRLEVPSQEHGEWTASIEEDLSNLLEDDPVSVPAVGAVQALHQVPIAHGRHLPFSLVEGGGGQLGGDVHQIGMQQLWAVNEVNMPPAASIGMTGDIGAGAAVVSGSDSSGFFGRMQRGRLYGDEPVGGMQGDRAPPLGEALEGPARLSSFGMVAPGDGEALDSQLQTHREPTGFVGLPVGFGGTGLPVRPEAARNDSAGFAGMPSSGGAGILGSSIPGGNGPVPSIGGSTMSRPLGGVVGAGLGESFWGNGGEPDELIASIPTGLFDDLEGGEDENTNGSEGGTPAFFLQKETSSGSSNGASRFSLWGMPLEPLPSLDAPPPPPNPVSPQMFAGHSQFSDPAQYVGFNSAGVVGGLQSLVNGDRPVTDMSSTSSVMGVGLVRNGQSMAIGQGLTGESVTGRGDAEVQAFADGNGKARDGVSSAELVRALVDGTTFSEADFAGTNEMLSGLSHADVQALLETVRPKLLATDRAVLRDSHDFVCRVLQWGRQQRNAEEPAGSSVTDLAAALMVGSGGDGAHFNLGTAGLAGVSTDDASERLRGAQSKLGQGVRGGVQNGGALAGAKEEARRGTGASESAGGQHAALGDESGERSSATWTAAGQVREGGELQGVVRKAIRELASQTCFEESDLERPHLSLLAGMPPQVACQVLRTVKARLAKTKRRDHRSPAAFLFGALTSAARAAMSSSASQPPAATLAQSQSTDAQIEGLREQIRRLGGTPDA